MSKQEDGWDYNAAVVPEGDARKIVTLTQDGMTWVGIRAFDHSRRRWVNNGEPEIATVLAWQDLPEPARGRWINGRLYGARAPKNDGLMEPMPPGESLIHGDG